MRERRKTFRTLGTTIRILSNNRARLIEQVLYPGRLRQREEKKRGRKKKSGLEKESREKDTSRKRDTKPVEPESAVRLFIRYFLVVQQF